MLTIGKYVRAQSAAEALELVRNNRRATVLGGGMWLRLGTGSLPVAIDLTDCGLNSIEEVPAGPAGAAPDETEPRATELRIGAYVTLRQVETNAAVAAATNGLLARAVRDIVGVQFRNGATIGGSVAGRLGFSDVVCALLALGADVELEGAGRMPLAQFLAEKGRMRDVLTHVYVPVRPAGALVAGYQAVRRAVTDFPVVNVCAAHDNGGWRVAVGARPAKATLIGWGSGKPLSLSAEDLAAAAAAAEELAYSGNMWGGEKYRRQIAGVLVRRALEAAVASAADCPGEEAAR